MTDVTSFWIGRNPGSTRLPYLLRLPVAGEGRVFLAARETWPRGKDVFCHQIAEWPAEADVVEEVPVEACWRVGAAVHLVLQRRTNRRSMFVWTRVRGRPAIFWRSPASMEAARPGVRVPQARGLERPVEIAVDTKERYPWRFPGKGATLARRDLPVGDYAIVRDGLVVAAVERKTVADLATAAVAGKLGLALAELERLPHAAVAIEGRWSDLVKVAERADVSSAWLLSVVAGLQVAHPRVTWQFAEAPKVAQDWAYRWLAVTETVLMELLAGAPSASGLVQVRSRLIGLPVLRLEGLADFEEAAHIYRTCRDAGETLRNQMGCLIAVPAIRHGASLLHNDRDFETIARHTTLRLEPVEPERVPEGGEFRERKGRWRPRAHAGGPRRARPASRAPSRAGGR